MSKKSTFSIVFALFFLILACIFALRSLPTVKSTEIYNMPAVETLKSSPNATFVKKSSNGGGEIVKSTPESSVLSGNQASLIKVNLFAGDVGYIANVVEGASVYDVMATLASTTSFRFKARHYSSLGYFIEEINGVKNSNGAYWTLYVNGKYSPVGASEYALRQGNSVEWKFEKK